MREICPLCREATDFVDSHIVPRFFWKRIKDNGQYELTSAATGTSKKAQKEYKEKLLCKNCDNVVLREYESHLAKLIYIDQEGETAHSKNALHLKGLSYHMLKRSILSIAWRMHHSGLEPYKKISLNDQHEHLIRSYLRKEIELKEDEFPLLIAAPLIDGEGATRFMLTPFTTHFDDMTPILHITLQGMIFSIFLDESFSHPKVQNLILKEDGSLVIPKADILRFPFIREALKKLSPSETSG
jgi:hypothetical protein